MHIQVLSRAFHVVCLLMSIGFIVFFASDYCKETSTALVDFKAFHETENDIFPSLTLCFGLTKSSAWNTKKLNATFDIQNYEDYRRYLRGKLWDERMTKVDYDNVTLKLRDHLTYWKIWVGKNYKIDHDDAWIDKDFVFKVNGSLKELHLPFTDEQKFRFFTVFKSAEVKCFSLALSRKSINVTVGKEIKKLVVYFHNSSFITDSYFYYSLHYPGQFLLGNFFLGLEDPRQRIFPGRIKRTIFTIDGMEIIKRRNTKSEPCKERSDQHDKYMLRTLIDLVKCRPSHFSHDHDFAYTKICNSSDAMNKIYKRTQYIDDLQFRKEYDKPCDQLQMVTYSRRDILKDKNERLKLGWALQLDFMREVYKEIRHIRDYDKKGLFSDVSAIIGFICGFSIWQAPDALKIMVISMKNMIYSSKI